MDETETVRQCFPFFHKYTKWGEVEIRDSYFANVVRSGQERECIKCGRKTIRNL